MTHLWRLLQAVSDESAPALQAIGLTPKSLGLLAAVEKHPFPAELARLMVLPPPTVTYLVKQLEAKGYLKRKAEPGDLRKFRLVVTDEGRQAIREGGEAVGTFLARRLARLEPVEIAMFDRLVDRLATP
jgi:DNA-binding MarR family transcriptional regulator